MSAQGRRDHDLPLWSPRTLAKVQLGTVVVGLVAAWQAAVAVTTPVEVTDLSATTKAVFSGRPLADVGAGVGTVVLFGVLVVALLAVFAVLTYARARWRHRTRGGKGLAGRRDIRDRFGPDAVRATAAYLRPGLDNPKKAPIKELGYHVGDTQSGPVIIDFDTHASVLGPTGAGKSRDFMTPAAQDAPGALVVTTNEATILDALVPARRSLGRIWVFDPLGRTHWPEPMVWDAVAGCEVADRASARGGAFCAGIAAGETRSNNEAFFVGTATTAMEALLHAAALGEGSMSDVLGWALAMGRGVNTPAGLIRDSQHPDAEPMWEQALKGVATGADDTVASTRTTLQGAIKPMLRRSVLRWVDPVAADEFANRGDSTRITPVPRFDAEAFVESTDTLVIVSDDNASTDVGPLCSMLIQEVVDAHKSVAPSTALQRIDPPIRYVLDEIANVAPIPKLPEIATELRKLGGQMMLAFQDEGQATARWGKDRGMKLLTQMGVEVVLSGVKSSTALERYSKLSGEVDVVERSSQVDLQTGRSSSAGMSVHTRPVLRPDEIRGMPDGQALVIYRNIPAFMVRMLPWWERPGGAELREKAQLEAEARAQRARQARAARRAQPTLETVTEATDVAEVVP